MFAFSCRYSSVYDAFRRRAYTLLESSLISQQIQVIFSVCQYGCPSNLSYIVILVVQCPLSRVHCPYRSSLCPPLSSATKRVVVKRSSSAVCQPCTSQL